MTGPYGGPPEPTVPAPAHCYRHPDRETYVSCSRCGRPICPECMRPASVGFHCPEDVREAQQGRRPARTALGGVAGRGLTERGRLTQGLVALCVVAFVLQGLPLGGLTTGPTLNRFTADLSANGFGIQAGEYYRLLTATFLHVSLLHLAFNMYALYLLGTQLERLLGAWRYLSLFVVCGVAGSVLTYVVQGPAVDGIGASTSIFGFFAAFLVVARRLRVDTGGIVAVIAINLVITFVVPGIGVYGHLGGLGAGLLLGAVYAYVPPRRGVLQAALTFLLLAALLAAAVAKTQTIS